MTPQKSECAGTNTIAALLAGASDAALDRHLDVCAACRQLVADLGRGLSRIGGASPAAAMPKVGERLGRFAIERVVGAGGMGVVYEAHDAVLDRTVALKLVRPDLIDVHLVDEAKAMARLEHPNVVRVHDVGDIAGHTFVCMEYIAGTTLRAWSREPRSVREVLDVFTAAGRGLAYVHAAGLVHLDFKPDNVLIGRGGRVVVGDFGLARATGSIGAVGTPAYMAPEQRRGERTDARADQYAYCVSLREAIGDRAPRWLDRVIARGLAQRPELRFAGMDALLAAIANGQKPRGRWLLAAAIAAIAAVGVSNAPQVVEKPIVQRVVEQLPGERVFLAAAEPPDAAREPAVADVTAPDSIERRVTVAPGSLRGATAHAIAVADTDEPWALAQTTGRPRSSTTTITSTTPSTGTNGPALPPPPPAPMSQPGDCDDGTLRTCGVAPPGCPPQTVLAVQSGCWTCADSHSCASLGVPHSCDDGSTVTCTTAHPACPGHQVAAVHDGCWQCADPFTCRPGGTPPPTGCGSGSACGGMCGNGFCEVGEDHASCPQDCCEMSGSGGSASGSGGCAAVCGNGFCEFGESYASCASDCCQTTASGACVGVCGNGFCESDETHAGCPADCL